MTLAVIGPPGRAHVAWEKLQAAELTAVEDMSLRHLRDDDSVVFHAVAGDDFEAALALHQESLQLLTAVSGIRAAFQPIWSVHPNRLGPLGFELLVVDDDDACKQLDLFYDAFRADPVMNGARRSHVTIAPRAGWQGYTPVR